MKYEVNQNDIYLWQNDFDLDETLDCGQAFRWKRIESEYDVTYIGTFLNTNLKISKSGDKFIFHNTTENDFLNIWVDYFDLNTDYSKLKDTFSADETLKKACEFAG